MLLRLVEHLNDSKSPQFRRIQKRLHHFFEAYYLDLQVLRLRTNMVARDLETLGASRARTHVQLLAKDMRLVERFAYGLQYSLSQRVGRPHGCGQADLQCLSKLSTGS